jgi:hypothetical protein
LKTRLTLETEQERNAMTANDDSPPPNDFEQMAEQEAGTGTLIGDFWRFLAENKKWWLTPIILALLGIGLLLLLSSSAVAPFIYTLF